MNLADFLPMLPWEGPPLPRFLGIFWPRLQGGEQLLHSPKLLGDKWQGSELGKIMIYNSLGWRCLVIWEHELKELSEEEIVAKIRDFHGRGRRYARATHT